LLTSQDWQRRVRTWFDQPARKQRRRLARTKRAAALAPRPTTLLRPAIRCPGLRYNIKIREGRGFTFEELKKAGFEVNKARKLGIAVDHRRRNTNEESLEVNVARLNAYKAKLIVFPRKTRGKKGEKKMAVDVLTLYGMMLMIETGSFQRSRQQTYSYSPTYSSTRCY
jgi:large subunit ribosomal protein L13e